MSSSSPPPDRFQREIDDIIRIAEKRLERQSVGGRAQRRTRALRSSLQDVMRRLPSAEMMAGWALALLLLSWLLGLLSVTSMLGFWLQVIGVGLLVAALVASLTRGQRAGWGGGGEKMWRGEPIRYGSPYARRDGFLRQLRRLFRGRR